MSENTDNTLYTHTSMQRGKPEAMMERKEYVSYMTDILYLIGNHLASS